MITRDGALERIRSSSNDVSRNGPSTWAATVDSCPSELSIRVGASAPALCTSASTRSWRASSSAAPRRISSGSDMSATTTSRVAFPVERAIASRASVVLPAERPQSTTDAPHRARVSAIENPRPEVAPVTTMVRPARLCRSTGRQCPRRERTSYPTRVKLVTMGISIAESATRFQSTINPVCPLQSRT
ncbi:unannotated protein [freshwater metagenome]|uniref:Unannotated protein n=1 Tax=freshwater metagenome TaxID=449393 RepID=A0A6J6YMS0_9ZZZZ